jgi:hypothetical protein
MNNIQFFTIIGMLAGGFGWLIHQLNYLDKRMNSLESRITVIETILSMLGLLIKAKKE